MTAKGGSEPNTADRFDVLGAGVSAISIERGVTLTRELIDRGGRGYICVTGVHGITEALKDEELMGTLNASFLTTPDGMPLVWIGRMQGLPVTRVYGPDFMMALCDAGLARGYRHFLYGGNVGVAERLRDVLIERLPDIQIVGTFTPPFRPLNAAEEAALIRQVKDAAPHVIWVGLSTPKQERFMAEYLPKLDAQIMVGVGAAFDIHTGGIRDAPQWMKRMGLQWVHRVLQEPRRLAKRYLLGNTVFVLRIARQLMKARRRAR